MSDINLIIDGNDLSEFSTILNTPNRGKSNTKNKSLKLSKELLKNLELSIGGALNSEDISLAMGREKWWFKSFKFQYPETLKFIMDRYSDRGLDTLSSLKEYQYEIGVEINKLAVMMSIIDTELKVKSSRVLFPGDCIFIKIKQNCYNPELPMIYKKHFVKLGFYQKKLEQYALENNVDLKEVV